LYISKLMFYYGRPHARMVGSVFYSCSFFSFFERRTQKSPSELCHMFRSKQNLKINVKKLRFSPL